MGLRWFHMVFLLCAMVALDMFGAWAVYDYRTSEEVEKLVFAIVCFTGAFALIGYSIWLVRKMDNAGIK